MSVYFRSDLAAKRPSLIDVPQKRRMMCLNESCLDPYQAIKDKFLKRMQDVHLNRYLSPITEELHALLTDYAGHSLKPGNLLWGNGADDILYHIFLAVREDDNAFAVSLAPSYFDYKTFCGMVGLKIKFLDLQEDFSFDTEEYLALASDPDCRLAILCNPNNPSGNLYSSKQLLHIIESLPDKLVLVDETYFEFSEATLAGELERHPNLILVRSFSKSFSGAGLRFGYAISSEENINSLRKVLTTFHTSILNQAFALTILENKELFQAQVREIKAEREKVLAGLRDIGGITVHPSSTNFLAFSAGDDTHDLFIYLQNNDIAVRDVGAHPRLKNHLRVTISCVEDNAAFLSCVAVWAESHA